MGARGKLSDFVCASISNKTYEFIVQTTKLKHRLPFTGCSISCNPVSFVHFLLKEICQFFFLLTSSFTKRSPAICHAHESLFVVLGGRGELRLGSERVPLTVGDLTCVPRWVVHQTHNTSSDHDLLLLAITDFGLTSPVLGDDDHALEVTVLHPASTSPEKAVADLEAAALSHRAVRHPYLEALADGRLPDSAWALADFALQYQGYSVHFPRFLSAVISRLEKPAHRHDLLANLMEESGQYDDRELALLENQGIASE